MTQNQPNPSVHKFGAAPGLAAISKAERLYVPAMSVPLWSLIWIISREGGYER
jgi:hypothetical protein